MNALTRIADIPRRLLWRIVVRIWHPKNWRYNALHYVREWWPEELLMQRIFVGPRRFLNPKWWWIKAVCLSLPKRD